MVKTGKVAPTPPWCRRTLTTVRRISVTLVPDSSVRAPACAGVLLVLHRRFASPTETARRRGVRRLRASR
jgi:hypothetical protein